MVTIYYASKSRETFFNDEHPSYRKSIWVPDPNWEPPHVTITLQPSETYGNTVNDTDEPIELDLGPDQSIEHPQIEIPNPNCLLPDDAVPVSLAVRDACLQASYGINWDTEPPTPNTAPVLSPAQLWAAYQAQARLALAATDAELAGLVEYWVLSEAPPASAAVLVTYRRALHAIVAAPGGNPNLPLPVRS